MSHAFTLSHRNHSNSLNPEGNHLNSAISSKNRQVNKSNIKLWKQSQTSLNFITPKLSFHRQKRFSLHSIYWPQNHTNQHNIIRNNKQKSSIQIIAKKISKQIDEEIKNQIRNQNKSTISENKSKITSLIPNMKKKNSLTKQETKKFFLNQKNQQIITRLTAQCQKKQSKLRDRNGIRSNLLEEDLQSGASLINNTCSLFTNLTQINSSTGFKTSSKRINLYLPLNYYPGPGEYEIKRYLQDLDKYSNSRPKQVSAR